MIKVYIDPCVNIYFASFYVKGLYDLFGDENVAFNPSPFIELKNRSGNFNFVIHGTSSEKRYSISFNDSYEINKECYEWCDKYGSVNTNRGKTPNEFHSKLVTLAPGFGIRLWNFMGTICHAVSNYSRISEKINFRKYCGIYKRQYQYRLSVSKYSPQKPEENYVFHVSTLWPGDEWIQNNEYVNRLRAIFMNTCKSIPGIHFEGGFYHNGKFKIEDNFKELILNNYIPIQTYIDKIKQSTLVFNTPAWQNCNGWKLGEYLALGKAILSTPLLNDLPEPLVHGENVHFISDDPEEIRKAIVFITSHDKYREKISSGAYQYYLKYASPISSLKLMGIEH